MLKQRIKAAYHVLRGDSVIVGVSAIDYGTHTDITARFPNDQLFILDSYFGEGAEELPGDVWL